jgi:sugar phosphate isomerase/epimerase
MLNRREMIATMAGALPAGLLAASSGENEARSPMGVAEFSFNFRIRTEREQGTKDALSDSLRFLEHCRQIGAGGIQKNLGASDEASCRQLREKAEQYGMYVEGSTGVPQRDADLERFEATLRTAKQCGAKVVRTAMGGRRYEVFERLDQFREWAKTTEQAVRRAEPLLAKHEMVLAVENHKDRRVDEMLAMLQRLDSEHVGVCVDLGNDLALLADPMEMVQAYAPWARSVHVKDVAVAECDDGFLLADVVLGQGMLDLAEMTRILRQANPEVRFSLEMSTRDPLVVPCLTEKYWATLGQVSAKDLARTLRWVRDKGTPETALPRAEHLPAEERIKLEEENIQKCLAYAREHLGL